MPLICRLARPSDYEAIQQLYTEFDILLDLPHVVGMFVIERVEEAENKVVAVGSLTTILESTLLVRREERARTKIDCLNQLMDKAIQKTKANGYGSFHVFFDTLGEDKTLKKSYGFVADKVYNLVKWCSR